MFPTTERKESPKKHYMEVDTFRFTANAGCQKMVM